MAREKSEAIILKTFNWAESSRTVVILSRDFGKLPLIDKGGRSITSKRGRLIPFARLEIGFHYSEKTERGYINDVDLLEQFSLEKEGTLGRLAYGSAACELLYLLLPDEESHTLLYDYLVNFLRHIDQVEKHYLPAVFLAFFLRLLSHLGYHPSLSYCIDCGKETDKARLPDRPVLFSPERGGVVCPACERDGEYYIPLSAESYRVLSRLQTASLSEAATAPIGYQEASLLIDALTKFLSYQSGLVSGLKSLEFLEKLRNSHLTLEKDSR
jgi:DNA repair protein RecO (recombination protein O)